MMMMTWALILAVGFFVLTMGLAVGPLLACRLFVACRRRGTASDEQTNSGAATVPSSPAPGVIFGSVLAVAIGLLISLFWTTSPQHATIVLEQQATIGPDQGFESRADATWLQVAPPSETRTVGTFPSPRLIVPESAKWVDDRATPSSAVLLLVVVITGLATSLALGKQSFDASRRRASLPVLAGLASVLAVTVAVISIKYSRTAGLQAELAHRAEVDRLAAEHSRMVADLHTRQAVDVTRNLTAAAAILSPPLPRPPEPADPVPRVPVTPDAVESSPVAAAEATSAAPSAADSTLAGIDAEPSVMEYVSTNPVGVPRETLPQWTTDGGDGVSAIRVIDSGLHATVELAERNTLHELTTLLTQEFLKRHPEARGWVPDEGMVLRSGSLLQRAIERSEITVGEFTNPMYKAYWQVDTNAAAGLYDAWRPTVVRSRLGWIGGGFGLLTLLFGSTAAVLRVNQQTGGRRLKSLAVGTLAIWGAIGTALLFVA